MSYQSEPVDLYGEDEDEYWDAILGLTGEPHTDADPGTERCVTARELVDKVDSADHDAAGLTADVNEHDQQFWEARSEGSIAAREVVDDDVVSAVENAVVLPADVNELDRHVSESWSEGLEAAREVVDNDASAVDTVAAFPADENKPNQQASETRLDAPSMKPAAKQGSNVVLLDEDELDAEEH